jgi:phenylalanine-4-hydroxylase
MVAVSNRADIYVYKPDGALLNTLEFGSGDEITEGEGLASSFGEAHFSLESDTAERFPFSVERAVRTGYKHDAFQPRYLVSESLDDTVEQVLALNSDRLRR